MLNLMQKYCYNESGTQKVRTALQKQKCFAVY